jgi:probable HAF family extracellular repeat protein
MKRISILLLVFFTCFALAAWPQAQTQTNYQQYTLYDLGTLGGPDSILSFFVISVTNKGVIGGAQTAGSDPFNPNCLGPYIYDMIQTGCYVTHAFLWNHGTLTDLGAFPGHHGKNSSLANAINSEGVIAGMAENGHVDPDTGYPEVRAVIWNNGKIRDLDTFGGTQSDALDLNDRGQVVGWASNTTPDPFSAAFEQIGMWRLWPVTTQIRAFVWENGVKRDLGTLGGPDAMAYAINRSGQIAGYSYTNDTPNPDTGIPTVDPVLWEGGWMIDLGTLGGTIGYAVWLNDRGQVVGSSNLAGDQASHGFLWERGFLRDLPPPKENGGDYSWTYWINELGDVVGGATLSGDELFDAMLWRFGKPIDLGTIGQDVCSEASGMNDLGQIVGISNECSGPWDPSGWATMRAFLWQKGSPMVDLNALVEKNPTSLHLYWGAYINDSGEILAEGILPTGDIHAALLVPSGDCKEDCERRIVASRNTPAARANAGVTSPASGEQAKWLHNRPGQRHALPGQH